MRISQTCFNLPIETEVFPDKLKTSRVTPVYKASDSSHLTNYTPISVLPCFSKILEKIMYNRLFFYVSQEKILHSKKFGFQSGHSTKHAIVQFTNQIHESFENNLYNLGVLADISKSFDTVNHSIILNKLEIYGIHEKNIEWFKSHLTNREQYIPIDDKMKQTFHQLHVEFHKILDPVMFVYVINLFFSNCDIVVPFATVNSE